MSTTIELPTEVGLPVEIGRIDKELGKLWESSGDTKTRASLVNLAIYTEDVAAVADNTALISQIASEHACRALLIFANPRAAEFRARAWINAHCHLAGGGHKGVERQICSEQITFQLDGEAVTALPNIVFSHLDSDLPLYFWWQGEFHEPVDEKLWMWVDRLIYDSADWSRSAGQFAIVRKIGALDGKTMLCDLNWSRLLATRFALAQVFDHSFALRHLRDIERVSLVCAHRTTGVLLLGWLAAQLGWKFQSLLGKESFLAPSGKSVEFEIAISDGPAVAACNFFHSSGCFEVTHDAQANFFHVCMSGSDVPCAPIMASAGKSGRVDILLTELGRGGRHPLYLKSLAAIEPLLEG